LFAIEKKNCRDDLNVSELKKNWKNKLLLKTESISKKVYMKNLSLGENKKFNEKHIGKRSGR